MSYRLFSWYVVVDEGGGKNSCRIPENMTVLNRQLTKMYIIGALQCFSCVNKCLLKLSAVAKGAMTALKVNHQGVFSLVKLL